MIARKADPSRWAHHLCTWYVGLCTSFLQLSASAISLTNSKGNASLSIAARLGTFSRASLIGADGSANRGYVFPNLMLCFQAAQEVAFSLLGRVAPVPYSQ